MILFVLENNHVCSCRPAIIFFLLVYDYVTPLFSGTVIPHKGNIVDLMLSNRSQPAPEYSNKLLQFIAKLCKTGESRLGILAAHAAERVRFYFIFGARDEQFMEIKLSLVNFNAKREVKPARHIMAKCTCLVLLRFESLTHFLVFSTYSEFQWFIKKSKGALRITRLGRTCDAFFR